MKPDLAFEKRKNSQRAKWRYMPRYIKSLFLLMLICTAMLVVCEWRFLPEEWGTPITIIAVPISLIFLWTSTRWEKKARRIRAGLCASCGYDLRASKGRCPECGSEIEKVVAAVDTHRHENH
jgi:hypothetical protein